MFGVFFHFPPPPPPPHPAPNHCYNISWEFSSINLITSVCSRDLFSIWIHKKTYINLLQLLSHTKSKISRSVRETLKKDGSKKNLLQQRVIKMWHWLFMNILLPVLKTYWLYIYEAIHTRGITQCMLLLWMKWQFWAKLRIPKQKQINSLKICDSHSFYKVDKTKTIWSKNSYGYDW